MKCVNLSDAVAEAVRLATTPYLKDGDITGYVNIDRYGSAWDVQYSLNKYGFYSIAESTNPEPAEVHMKFILSKLEDVNKMDQFMDSQSQSHA